MFLVVLLLLGVAAARPLWDPTAGNGNGNGQGQGNGNGNGQGQGQGQGRDRAPGQNKDKTKAPEVDLELQGTVESATDDKGRPTFTMTVDGTTWELSAGPKWYWGEDNPLADHVGDTVTVAGSHHEGETDLSVAMIDGTAIREPGKPPWAGGPKRQATTRTTRPTDPGQARGTRSDPLDRHGDGSAATETQASPARSDPRAAAARGSASPRSARHSRRSDARARSPRR